MNTHQADAEVPDEHVVQLVPCQYLFRLTQKHKSGTSTVHSPVVVVVLLHLFGGRKPAIQMIRRSPKSDFVSTGSIAAPSTFGVSKHGSHLSHGLERNTCHVVRARSLAESCKRQQIVKKHTWARAVDHLRACK